MQREVWNTLAEPWSKFRKKVWPETKQFLSSHSGLILDLGCGSGRNFEKIKGKIIGIDFAENQLYQAEKSIKERKLETELVCGDAADLPFKNEIFDACIFVSTLHCIRGEENRLQALKELKRVLKTNAEIFITVWNREQPRFKGKKDGFIPWKIGRKRYMRYYYLFDKKELAEFLEFAGFQIVDIHGSESKVFNLFQRNIIALVRKR